MTLLLNIIMGLTLSVSAGIFLWLIKSTITAYLSKSKRIPVANNPETVDIEKFNCRVIFAADETGNGDANSFKVEICGTIHAPEDGHETTAKVFVSDITDGTYKAGSVHSATEQWHLNNSPIFCYDVDLGSLPNAQTVLPDWMMIADIPCESMILPRTGARLLQFRTSIFTHNTSDEIAHGACQSVYENQDDGYLDVEEYLYQANALGVTLALSFAACGSKKIAENTLSLIKKWAKGNLDKEHQPGNFAIKFWQILAVAIARIRFIENHRIRGICKVINDTAPLDIKCNILMLCISVISNCEKMSSRQIEMLKSVADLFDIDIERLRAMIEALHPFAMHEVNDLEICLGITSEMDERQIKQQLSAEYRKWNSRIINTSAEIRDEAENMLNLIGETKEELCV